MRLTSKQPQSVHIDMIPLIDSLFVLLAFFLFIVSTMVIQKTVPINLPSAASSQVTMDPVSRVSIDANETVYWNETPVSTQRLSHYLTPPPDQLIIRVDENVRHKVMVQILDITRQVGIKNVMVQTQ